MAEILYNKIYPKGVPVTNIKVGLTEVKYAKKGNILVYDTLLSNSYGTPEITTFFYNSEINSNGGNCTPSKSFSQTFSKIGQSGSNYPQSNITSDGTWTFSIPSTTTGASINSSTGIVTWTSNPSYDNRSVEVTALVTSNGKTSSYKKTICVLSGKPHIEAYFKGTSSKQAKVYLAQDFSSFINENYENSVTFSYSDPDEYGYFTVVLTTNLNYSNIDTVDLVSEFDYGKWNYYGNDKEIIFTFSMANPPNNKDKCNITMTIISFDGTEDSVNLEIKFL